MCVVGWWGLGGSLPGKLCSSADQRSFGPWTSGLQGEWSVASEAPQLTSVELGWSLLKLSVAVGLSPALLHALFGCLPGKSHLFQVELVFISTNKNGLRS